MIVNHNSILMSHDTPRYN